MAPLVAEREGTARAVLEAADVIASSSSSPPVHVVSQTASLSSRFVTFIGERPESSTAGAPQSIDDVPSGADGEREDGLGRPAEVADAVKPDSSVLDNALAALIRLANDQQPSDATRMATARLLRSAAAERRATSPRVASAALVLSDAIAFTEPGGLTDGASAALQNGVRLLMAPFVSTAQEEELFISLMSVGWEVTPFFDPQAFAEISTDQEI